jgi:ATP-binding cassette subfamily B protein
MKKMIKVLFKSIREYKKDSIFAMLFVFFEVIMEISMPFLTSKLIDEIDADKIAAARTVGFDFTKIIWLSVALIAMSFVALGSGVLSGKYAASASAGFAKNLRKDLFKKVNDFSFANIDKFSSSSLVTRLTTDVSNVQMSFMMIIRTAVRAPFMMIFSIVMAFIQSVTLAWIFVIIVPLLLGGLLLIMRFAHPVFRRIFKKYDALNSSVQENVSGIRTVKSYVREDYEIDKFNKASGTLKNEFVHAERIIAWNQPVMQFAIYVLNLVVINLGAYLILSNTSIDTSGLVEADLTIGKLTSLITYGIQTLMALMMLSMIFMMIVLSLESAGRIVEVLEEKSSIVNPENPIMEVKDGSIDFDNVSFKYSEKAEKNALENVNLHIKSGQTIGILGGTGSSKTTLVNLISRLYDVSEGTLKVGGVNVKDYDLDTLRNQVSVVLQKNLLFSGTIAENLRWGDENATDEEIKKACDLACASEFIEQFKDGYNTHIEQGGSNVSGGQKQRLCIARALLKKPKVLILDDSTSAVDTKTDAKIREGLKQYLPDATKIIIAQRLSSIQDADLILIMEKGRIAASGTHKELMKTNTDYRETYLAQNHLASEEGGAC